ncbi:MAG: tetraacyldisaccharide 4'-kinase [Candidatus Hatepunaea meridiana]|nr:tetraacyldisaccharide 4'-kinase [Candidatus Hatepunaea meridiana]
MKPQGWLWPISILYQAVVALRNRLYNIGVFKTYSVNAPVISVGNLSVGGTGKTPFVIHLTERIKRLRSPKKVKIGVISRGYKGRASETLVVSDGKRQFFDYLFAGDEPVLICKSAPGVAVVVDKKRVRGSEYAVKNLRVKLILLDDGFQHRRLHRNLDIVLLDAGNPLGNRRVLPAGYLREPASALKRADLIVLSKAKGNDEELAERAHKLQELLEKPVIVTKLVPKYWRRFDETELLAPEEIAGKKVTAFAGIAKPDSFFKTIEDLGADLVKCLPMSDHCPYNKRHLNYISAHFVRSHSEWLVTTAKDALKLPPILRFLPAYYLESSMEVVAGEEQLDKMLLKVMDEMS